MNDIDRAQLALRMMAEIETDDLPDNAEQLLDEASDNVSVVEDMLADERLYH